MKEHSDTHNFILNKKDNLLLILINILFIDLSLSSHTFLSVYRRLYLSGQIYNSKQMKYIVALLDARRESADAVDIIDRPKRISNDAWILRSQRKRLFEEKTMLPGNVIREEEAW